MSQGLPTRHPDLQVPHPVLRRATLSFLSTRASAGLPSLTSRLPCGLCHACSCEQEDAWDPPASAHARGVCSRSDPEPSACPGPRGRGHGTTALATSLRKCPGRPGRPGEWEASCPRRSGHQPPPQTGCGVSALSSLILGGPGSAVCANTSGLAQATGQEHLLLERKGHGGPFIVTLSCLQPRGTCIRSRI